jgi:hypothetical protein
VIRPPRRAPAVLAALAAVLVLCALAGATAADPGRVLVLPLDGDAAPAIRTRYSASVQRLARTLGGTLSAGDATFTDTATAIGCDPKAPTCAEDVRATLGVDELVYGTVTKQNGQLVLTVRRTAKGKPRREVSTTFSASDSAESAEPAILPLFHDARPGPAEGTAVKDPAKQGPAEGTPNPNPNPTEPERPSGSRRDRTLGIAAAAGGGTMLLISLALWASASGLESDIANHPIETVADFQQLSAIEDTASARAWTGNVMFVAGLAVGGLGGWLLYRDRKAHRAVVAPAPMADGAGVTLTWRGGL